MTTNVMVRFECGAQGKAARELGPFEYVQVTYSELRDDKDNCVAYYENGYWVTEDHGAYSDIVVYSA